MRKLVVHMQVTLDGRISKPDGGFWEPFPWGDEETAYVNQMFAAADTWAMSGRMYEFVVPYWEQVAAGTALDIGVPDSPARSEFADLLTGLTKVVFSRRLEDDPDTRRVVRSGDLAAHLRDLKAADGKDIILSAGPATLGPIASEPRLIDEYLLVIHPAVLTAGPRLFDHLSTDLALRLVDAKIFDGGAEVMRYATADPS